MAARLNTFWTAYRRFLVEELLARGESRARIAAKLGTTPTRLNQAIRRLGLRARPLLELDDA